MKRPPSMSVEELHTLLSTVPKLKRRPANDYERDDRENEVMLHTLDRLIEEQERKKRQQQPRSDYELDDVESRILLRTLDKVIERDERRNRAQIVGLVKERAFDLGRPPGAARPRLIEEQEKAR